MKIDINGKEPNINTDLNLFADFKTPESKIKVLSVNIIKPEHARKVNFDFKPVNFNEVLAIDFKNNERARKGLCFICTFNFTESKIGIKCLTCLRVFHPKCIRSHNPMPPIVHSYIICNACNLAANKNNY